MTNETTAVHPGVIGREAELARVEGFVSGAVHECGLVLVGDPGIGKTTVWESALAAATAGGARVLLARPSEPEVQLSFVALSDLLEGVDTGARGEVPAPQLAALEVALLRAEPGEAPPQLQAVAAGFTRVVRMLAERNPVLIAVDDVPWLDRASQEVLAFSARRLRGSDVRFLLTRRPGAPLPLEAAFGPAGLVSLQLGALSLGAVRVLLAERLGLRPPRRVLLRVFELSQGSPLVALELGRMLVARGLPDVGEELPLPELVDDLFSHRVAELREPVRRALLAIALSGGLTRFELSSLVGPLALEDGISTGIVVVERGRVRASHPLLAAAARRLASGDERRGIHLDLAGLLGDETLIVRHLALAASQQDSDLGDRLAAAAQKALGRGAVPDAVELAEQALRLTPNDSESSRDRLVALARYLTVAGETDRVRELLAKKLPDLPHGADRARVLLMLAETGERLSDMEAYVDAALAECGDDAELRSTALATKALIYGIARFERLEQAEDCAREAMALAAKVGVDQQRRALHALAWMNVMRGRPVEGLGEGSESGPVAASLYESAVERPRGIQMMVRGYVDDSRAVFDGLRALAAERGEALSTSIMHRQLCEIELRAGDVHAAERHLEQWGEWTLPEDTHEQVVGWTRCRALLEALRGDAESAARLAQEAVAAAKEIENYREETEAHRAAGLAALFANNPKEAVEELRPLYEHGQREGIRDPGVLPVAPDLVEALVELGELEAARLVTEGLAELAEEQEHPWGLAGAQRCRALLLLAEGSETTRAESELGETATRYAGLGLRFDAARTLLLLGRSQRRGRRWAAARATLEQAAAGFTELGASGWVDRAQAELSRVGARRPVPEGVLSSAEGRAAELAARGRSNKAIAAELHVTVNTVEKHLSRAYAKLGVRSRGELAQRLSPGLPDDTSGS